MVLTPYIYLRILRRVSWMPPDLLAQFVIFALERPEILGTLAFYIIDLLAGMVVDTLIFGLIVAYVWRKLPEETRREIVAMVAEILPNELSAYLFDRDDPEDPP